MNQPSLSILLNTKVCGQAFDGSFFKPSAGHCNCAKKYFFTLNYVSL